MFSTSVLDFFSFSSALNSKRSIPRKRCMDLLLTVILWCDLICKCMIAGIWKTRVLNWFLFHEEATWPDANFTLYLYFTRTTLSLPSNLLSGCLVHACSFVQTITKIPLSFVRLSLISHPLSNRAFNHLPWSTPGAAANGVWPATGLPIVRVTHRDEVVQS